MFKYILAICLIAAMSVTIAWIDVQSGGVKAPHQPQAERSTAGERIYATGIVEGATQDIELRPEQAGRVSEVLVAAGDHVEKGGVLLRLDGARQQREVALAEADLNLARAEAERIKNGARAEEREEAHALYCAAQSRLKQAEQTWQRIMPLRNERAISQQDADDQQAAVNTLRAELEAATARVMQIEAPAREDEMRAAEARVAAAQARLELARISLDKTELRAARAGRVLDVNVEPGEITGPDAGEPLVVLSDTSVVRVRAYVEELDAPKVQPGMQATITCDGLPDQQFTGYVTSVSPRMVRKSVFAERPGELYDTKVREVVLELQPTEELFVGLRVDISLQPSHEETGRETIDDSPTHEGAPDLAVDQAE